MPGLEDRFYARAEKLFVRGFSGPDGSLKYPTLAEVAAELGGEVSLSTVHRWSQKGEWEARRGRWRKVNQDIPTRLLAAAERRLNFLEDHPEEAKADEIYKLAGILKNLQADLAGGEAGPVDPLTIWIGMMNELTEDLRELAPEAIRHLEPVFDDLVKRARRRHA
ncbi:MAG: hypothetical protein AB1896_22115 [Thermodesulfobacteriota bacterium]